MDINGVKANAHRITKPFASGTLLIEGRDVLLANGFHRPDSARFATVRIERETVGRAQLRSHIAELRMALPSSITWHIVLQPPGKSQRQQLGTAQLLRLLERDDGKKLGTTVVIARPVDQRDVWRRVRARKIILRHQPPVI